MEAKGSLNDKYYVKITQTRSEEKILEKIRINEHIDVPNVNNMLYGDILVELFTESMIGQKTKVARMNCHLYFVDKETLSMVF